MSKKHKKKQNIKVRRISPRLVVGIAVGLFVGIALFLRIALPYDDIFTAYGVKFEGNDSYYYMRLVDNMVRNFPHLMSFDPYLVYPNGQPILSYHLFARLLAGASWLIGMGHPSQYVIDIVGVYMPVAMSVLVVIIVYFIGKALWSYLAGVFSAALIAVLPGEFLGRSILGATDHHIAEVLFSTMSMMFLVMAVKAANGRCIGFSSLVDRGSIRPIVYSSLSGLFLGLYGLTWQGGSLFLFIVSLYFVVQFVVDHLRRQSVFYLCVVGFVFNLVAMAVFLPSVIGAYNVSFYLASMGGALFLPIALGGLSWLLNSKKLRVEYYPAVIVCIGILVSVVFKFANSSLFNEAVYVLLFVFAPTNTQLTTSEMLPLLSPMGVFSMSVAWLNFGATFFVTLLSLVVLVCVSVRRGNEDKCLIVVWTIVVLAMALGQRRFSYYLAINVALLTGYLLALMFRWAGLSSWQNITSKKPKVNMAVVGLSVITFSVVFLSIIPSAVSTADKARYAPSDAWCESLDWLRNNSPDPFPNDSDRGKYWFDDDHWASSPYYAYEAKRIEGESQYGVLSWWDYGYWITRIAHRIPNVNPGQDYLVQCQVANFFMSQDEQAAEDIILEMGAEYVIIDFDTIMGKFWAIGEYAGRDMSEFWGVYYVPNNTNKNQLTPMLLYYPDYYRTLVVRLYNFGGEAVEPLITVVVSYEQKTDDKGRTFNLVTDARKFYSYYDAEDYIASQHSGNWMIIGSNPFTSPMPLDALEHYQLVYESGDKSLADGLDGISEVKIFRHME